MKPPFFLLTPSLVILWKWTGLLALGWMAHWVLRGQQARWRLMLWRSMLCFGLALPFLNSSGFHVLTIPIIDSDFPAKEVPVVLDRPAMNNASQPDVSTTSISQTKVVRSPSGEAAQAPKLKFFSERISWPEFLLTIWMAGCGYGILRLVRCHLQLARLLRRACPASGSIRELAKELGGSGVAILVSDATKSPFVSGAWKPVVVLPSALVEGLAQAELAALLRHEIAHVQRRDLIWSLGWRWMSAVWWFHPLVWKVCAAHGIACEEEADRAAAGRFGGSDDYAQLLARLALRVLALPEVETTLTLNGASQIARRLHYLRLERDAGWSWRKSAAGFGVAGVVFILIAGCQTKSRKTLETTSSNPTEYQGRPLVEWLEKLDDQHPGPENDQAIAAIQYIGTNALPTIIAMLPSSDFEHRGAVLACYQLGPKAAPAIPALVAALTNGFKRGYAGAALGRIGPTAVRPLTSLLTNGYAPVRLDAIIALGNMKMLYHDKGLLDMSEAIPALLPCLSDKSRYVRGLTARSLGQIAEGESEVVPALVKSLQDEDGPTQWSACLALGKFGTRARTAIPALSDALHDVHPDVRGTAALALVEIDRKNTAQLKTLMPLLIENVKGIGGTNINFCTVTAAALGDWGKEAEPSVPALLQAARDPHFAVKGFEYDRKQIIIALNKIDPKAAAAAGLK